MAEIEIRYRGRAIDKFTSDVDADDEAECVALLRRRARDLGKPAERLTLRTWGDRRRRREYRA